MSNRVTYFKKDEEEVMEMCAEVERYVEKYARNKEREVKAEEIVVMGIAYNVPTKDILSRLAKRMGIDAMQAKMYYTRFTKR